jgi:hypothetical protein
LGSTSVWIDGLSTLVGEYETDRDQYATLDSFMPRIVAYFGQYAEEFSQ